jgi:hypothetical protein
MTQIGKSVSRAAIAGLLYAVFLSSPARALRTLPSMGELCRENLVVVARVRSVTADPAPKGRIATDLVHADVETLIHGARHGARPTEVVFPVTGSPMMSPEDPPTVVGTRLLLFFFTRGPWPAVVTAFPYNGPLLGWWEALDPDVQLSASALHSEWDARCNPMPADAEHAPYQGGWFPSLDDPLRK